MKLYRSICFMTEHKASVFEGLSEITQSNPPRVVQMRKLRPEGEETFPRSHCEFDPRSAPLLHVSKCRVP